jgi:hypothetical protein
MRFLHLAGTFPAHRASARSQNLLSDSRRPADAGSVAANSVLTVDWTLARFAVLMPLLFTEARRAHCPVLNRLDPTRLGWLTARWHSNEE